MLNRNGLVPLDCNVAQINRAIEVEKKYLGNSAEALAEQQKWASYLEKAQSESPEAYNAARKKWAGQIISQSISLMLYTESIVTSMFDVITVTGRDVPAYHLEITPEIDVWRMSAHGYPASVVKYPSVTQYFSTPYALATDRIYQPRPSVLTGNVGPTSTIPMRARYEIAQQLEDDLWTLLTAAITTFSNAWVYDTRIQDMPTTNDVDLSAQGGLTKGLIQGILAAVDKIPARTPGGVVTGESAKIKNILIPSIAAQDMREWVSVVSAATGLTASQDADDTISPALQGNMESQGALLQSMWGENLGIRKVKRLMGTSAADWDNYLWVFLNGPAGRLIRYVDETRIDNYVDRMPYEEGMSVLETVAMEIPGPYAPNFMRVKFKT